MHRRVTVVGSVCLCVCLSVKSHLSSGVSVRPENTVVYSAGNGGKNICGFPLKLLVQELWRETQAKEPIAN